MKESTLKKIHAVLCSTKEDWAWKGTVNEYKNRFFQCSQCGLIQPRHRMVELPIITGDRDNGCCVHGEMEMCRKCVLSAFVVPNGLPFMTDEEWNEAVKEARE